MTATKVKTVTKHGPAAKPPKVRVVAKQKRSPEREALAGVVAEMRDAGRRVEDARQAKQRVGEMLSRARRDLAKAQDDIEAAKERDAKAAMSGKYGSGMKAARMRETTCADQLEAASAAVANCEQELRAAEEAGIYPRLGMGRAVGAVLAAEAAARLLEKTKTLQEQLVAARVALRDLVHHEGMPAELLSEAQSLLIFRDFPSVSGAGERYDWGEHPAGVKWRQAREALARDADHVLPE